METGIPFDTPTTARIREQRQARSLYVFRLDEAQVAIARRRGLPDSALLALGAIAGAAYGERGTAWVTIPPRTTACFGRGYRWWLRATNALEKERLIEVERHSGRHPRYRLLATPQAGP